MITLACDKKFCCAAWRPAPSAALPGGGTSCRRWCPGNTGVPRRRAGDGVPIGSPGNAGNRPENGPAFCNTGDRINGELFPEGGHMSIDGTSDAGRDLALRIATFKAQTLAELTGGGKTGSSEGFGTLLASLKGGAAAVESAAGSSGVQGLSPTGRNEALFDPESAYRMMSEINYRNVLYKGQFAELSQMQTSLETVAAAGTSLGSVDAGSSDEAIRQKLAQFVSDYNAWRTGFDEDMQQGGILADTQAAQVAGYELEQSVENPFNGADLGLRGMPDLGLSIDPVTKQAVLDEAALSRALQQNREGVVATVQQFSGNFVKSAELLTSSNNFFDRQLDNLSRAITYIADNQSSLQQEFGLGDTYQPKGKLAAALAAYERMLA
ncbi:MAG: hypothetical protein FDZ72_07190 [Betaproteobacteria bacterium]|nr:MAG: hypothetical protein FDZ72_07190 [Betaproteobacteria bacterium]